jgi:anti-sigma regulatory factor (Ser/Thr protein kinase)
MNRIEVELPDFGWSSFQWVHKRLFDLVERQGLDHVVIDFGRIERAYPNGFVPLVVLLDQYRHGNGTRFDIVLAKDAGCQRAIVENNWAAHLAPAGGFPLSSKPHALHRFSDDSSLNDLVNRQIRQVLERATYAEGVMQSFEWALNEVAGNVLVHAGVADGWMQVAVYPNTHHMAIVVADGGLGIPETIRRAFPDRSLPRDEDAIAYALQEGITSKPNFGQGKGLTGTLEIVKKNRGGRLSIHSREGMVEWAHDRLSIRGDFPPFRGTLVDIQLDTNEAIDIERALWGSAPGYPFNESLFGKDTPTGIMRLELIKEATGFGNRLTGQRIRRTIENLLTTAPNDVLEIDFTGVDLIASSFADEVFGKLAISLGFIGFATRVKLVGLNKFCRSIIDDAVQSRIIQSRSGSTDDKS